jgi:hypothetical protein
MTTTLRDMYRPPAFSVDDRDELFDMIERSPFANLVTSSDSGLEAAGLPRSSTATVATSGCCAVTSREQTVIGKP